MHVHVLDCLARLPNNSIDTVITSPPYWGLRDYKLPSVMWDEDPNYQHEWSGKYIRIMKSRMKWGHMTLDDSIERIEG
jgi:DNA modification methylase